jgi:hypothetical protein
VSPTTLNATPAARLAHDAVDRERPASDDGEHQHGAVALAERQSAESAEHAEDRGLDNRAAYEGAHEQGSEAEPDGLRGFRPYLRCSAIMDARAASYGLRAETSPPSVDGDVL